MHHITWSHAEKVIARQVFNAALQQELAELMSELKAQAQRAAEVDDIWRIHDFLGLRRREINEKYDYRYSQHILLFATLLVQKRIQAEDIAGLAEEKLDIIARVVRLSAR
jgi:hypothetical protein